MSSAAILLSALRVNISSACETGIYRLPTFIEFFLLSQKCLTAACLPYFCSQFEGHITSLVTAEVKISKRQATNKICFAESKLFFSSPV